MAGDSEADARLYGPLDEDLYTVEQARADARGVNRDGVSMDEIMRRALRATAKPVPDPRDTRIAALEAAMRQMIASVPGGSICDPQVIADDLREIASGVGVK